MARLNDPVGLHSHASTENIEAVKRRYLRQNRELAKTNSAQSVRIRNLESEGSRLLAENLQLREQVLQLQNALEVQSQRPSFAGIHSVKNQLETKIQELNNLVAELGQLKKPDSAPRCKSQTAATRRSPDERQWRSGLGLQQVEDAMLPTIVEDKHFPRRTMNADELRDILLEDPDSQSPDLGPPPTMRFENEDPIKFDPQPETCEEPPEPENEDAEPVLAVNLETRRKRRDSSGARLSIRRVSVFQASPEDSEKKASEAVRAGAKRKMSAMDEEEKGDLSKSQTEGFRFSRRNTPVEKDDGTDETSKSNNRKILGAKPVNTDPMVSPKKQRASALEKDKKPLPKPSRTRTTDRRGAAINSIEVPVDVPIEPAPTTDIPLSSLPPKTPAAEDIFSPPSTEPSTQRPETRDTPPPANLLSSADQTSLGGRARRARAQVSYAEPNLISKMRRPGKEMVDAVVASNGRTSSSEPPSTVQKSTIKKESEIDSMAWKSLPPAPNADAGDEVGEKESPLRDKVGRRDGQGSEGDAIAVQSTLNSSAAANAISALISGSSTSRRKPAAKETPNPSSDSSQPPPAPSEMPTAAHKPDPENLSIFDFTESSPPEAGTSSSGRQRIDLAKAAPKSNSRRHSSVSTSTSASFPSASNAIGQRKGTTNGSLPSLSAHSRTGSNGGGVRSASSSNLRGGLKDRERKPSSTITAAKESTRLAETKGDAAAAGGTGSVRASSRRKSMML